MTPAPANGEGAPWWRLGSGIVAVAALLAWFAREFDPGVNRPLVNFAWASAVSVWLLTFRRGGPRPVLRPRDVLPFAAFAVVYAALWLPFYDNWRWAGAGDSLPWFDFPLQAVERGLDRSLLSVSGVWNHFTYTQCMVDNALMFLFEPTFFWHRASKLLVSILALTAIYAFFVVVWDRRWALLIVVATAGHFIWFYLSYLSFDHVDSHLFAYASLTLAALLTGSVADDRRWCWLGVVAGLSLFFTQTAWADVAACGAVVGLLALVRRRPRGMVVYAVAFIVAAFPILLQLPVLLQQQSMLAQSILEWDYLSRMFLAVLKLPLGASRSDLDPNGSFFFPPFGWLYLAGAGLAVLGTFPPVRRGLGVPRVAPALVALFLWNAALLAVTNNAYAHPSWKRTYHLVPLQVFLCILPIASVAHVVRRWRVLEHGVFASAVVGVAAFVAANVAFFVEPPERNWGNVVDGMVQVRQRFADRKAIVLDPREEILRGVSEATSLLNRAYDLRRTLTVQPEIRAEEAAEACARGDLLCVFADDRANDERFRDAVRGIANQLREVPLHLVVQLRCYECGEARSSPAA